MHIPARIVLGDGGLHPYALEVQRQKLAHIVADLSGTPSALREAALNDPSGDAASVPDARTITKRQPLKHSTAKAMASGEQPDGLTLLCESPIRKRAWSRHRLSHERFRAG